MLQLWVVRIRLKSEFLSKALAPVGVAVLGVGAGHAVVLTGDGWVAIAIVAGAFSAILARARRLVLGITLSALVVGSGIYPPLRAWAFYGRFALFGMLVLVNILTAPTLRALKRERLLAFWMASVSLLALASVLWSVHPMLTAQKAAGFGLLTLAVATTAMSHWRNADLVRRDLGLVAAVLGSAILASLAAFLLGADWALHAGRLRGVLENPNTIGISVCILLPLAAGLAGTSVGWGRLLWIAVAATGLVTLVLAQSRGGLLGAIVGLAVFALRGRVVKVERARRFYLLFGLLALGLSIFIAAVGARPAVQAGEEIVSRFQEPTGSGRVDAWRLAFQSWGERPVTGWGFGTTEQVFHPRISRARTMFTAGLIPNGFIQTLFELGPVGLAGLLAAVAVAARSAFRTPGYLGAATAGGLMAGVAVQMFEAGITSPGSIFAFTFWLIGAAAIRLQSFSERSP